MATWLTLEELAERWREDDLSTLKRKVRAGKVPYFEPGRRDSDIRISWKHVRFRLEQIEKYELENTRQFGDKEQEPVEKRPKATVRVAAKEWYED
jgi:hypothetical protein